MNRAWLLAAAFLALAACGETDPLAEARAVCANPGSEAEARMNACTQVLEAGNLTPANQSAALSNRGVATAEAGDVTAALRDYEAALALDENNMTATLGRASILIDSGQLDAAEPLVRRLIESGEYAANAHFFDGNIALHRSDYPAAIAAYDRAIAADPQFAPPFANRALVKQSTGDLDGALADFTAALAINPQLSPALAGRCWTRITMPNGDLTAARADADAAVSADPANVQAQLCRGVLQLRAEQWADARASYDAALAVQPGNPSALFGRGVARRRGGDNDGRADMNRARDFEPNIARAYEELGVRTF